VNTHALLVRPCAGAATACRPGTLSRCGSVATWLRGRLAIAQRVPRCVDAALRAVEELDVTPSGQAVSAGIAYLVRVGQDQRISVPAWCRARTSRSVGRNCPIVANASATGPRTPVVEIGGRYRPCHALAKGSDGPAAPRSPAAVEAVATVRLPSRGEPQPAWSQLGVHRVPHPRQRQDLPGAPVLDRLPHVVDGQARRVWSFSDKKRPSHPAAVVGRISRSPRRWWHQSSAPIHAFVGPHQDTPIRRGHVSPSAPVTPTPPNPNPGRTTPPARSGCRPHATW